MSTTFTPIEVPMTVSASTEAVRTNLRSGIPYVANGITDPDTKSAGDVLQYNGSAWVASDELTDLKEELSQLSGLSDEAKTALLACFANVAWIDDDGQDYYDALYAALYDTTWAVTNTLSHCSTSNNSASVTKNGSYSATITAASGYTLTGASVSVTMGGNDITSTAYNNGTISIASVTGALVITITATAKTLSSISAAYAQDDYIFDTDDLDVLKNDLIVTATYNDSSTATVPSDDYTLSGTLATGTSTITVTYQEKIATFTVSVSNVPSGYTALDYVAMSGSQYANTGYYEQATPLSAEYKFRITTAPSSTAPNQHILSASTNMYYPYLSNDSSRKSVKVAIGSNGTGSVDLSSAWQINQDYIFKVDIDSLKYYLDGVFLHSLVNGGTYDTTKQFTIGTYGGSPTTAKYRLKGWIYYIKLYDTNGVAHYYKPAKRDNDDVIGFYDIVTNNFYTSETSTAFSGGNLT